jgi:hypothetical protein
MRQNAFFKLVLLALLCGSLLFGYSAWKFDRKVRVFNTKIHIGDSLISVRVKLGAPSQIIIEHQDNKRETKYRFTKSTQSILWIYYGSPILRKDLGLVFDEPTQKLVEKKRGIFVVE